MLLWYLCISHSCAAGDQLLAEQSESALDSSLLD